MNDEILKLAKKCWPDEYRYDTDDRYVTFRFEELGPFYRAAFNAGLEAAAKMCDAKAEVMAIMGGDCDPDDLAAAIRALKVKE